MGGWGEICYFVFTVLPFGLTSELFIFAKVTRCLVKHWRINAIRIACFLDDGLGVASSYKMILFHLNFVKKSLQNADLSKLLNTEMSLMNYQHVKCMSGGSIMLMEAGFTNYWHDRCMSGESKMFETDTGLMNYRHARYMSSWSKILTETCLMNYWNDRRMSGESKK